MPVITNFGDVVTTGNTLLFGNLTVLNTSTVLSGNLLPNVSGSSNLGQLGSQFGSAFVRSINAFSLNVTTQANLVSLNVSGTAFFANSNLALANVTTANVSAANIASLNVSGTTFLIGANIVTANVTSGNVSTANVSSSLNVSGTTFLLGANIVTANVTSGNIATANVSSSLNVSGTTFLIRANIVTANVTSANVSTANVSSSLNVSGTTFLIGANIVTANVTSGNIATANVSSSLNVSGTTFLLGANIVTANVTTANVSTGNVSTLNVATLSATTLNITSASNLSTTNVTTMNVSSTLSASSLNVTTASNLSTTNALTMNVTSLSASSLNVTSASNLSVCNTSSLNVSGSSILFQANVLTANITSGNVLTANVTSLNVSGTAFLSNANVLTANISTGNIVSLNVTGDANIANLRIASNLITNNIIMASNLSTNSGFGNVYLTGNLVVNGNIFSSGGSVGSGSGTSQGVLFTYAASNTLPAAFATGTAGPGIAGYHLNLTGFSPEATQAVTQFTYNSGMLKFSTAGLYQVTCVIAGDQPAVKVAVGKTSSATFPPVVTATAGYDYVYNYPTGASPSHVVTLPLTVTDITQYYYLDVFFSTVAGTPSVLYPTRSTTAAGSAYGTYVQVAPFGNYLTSATGVASALLANCAGSSNLSGVYSSNAYRLTLTSANGWTVNGTSTSLAVTANGNFQVNQTGIYEVNLCLNTVGQTACQFQVGSLSSDSAAPGGTTPLYLYTYAPMYTQDPTTVIQLPLNITNISNVYFVECSFPGTLTGNVALTQASTFVSVKPIGGYISTGTDPWIQQGTSVYYNGGPVGIGGVVPTALTETLTVNGNTSFVGNVTVTSDASGSSYVTGKRVPAGSLSVANYVTGSVPLTTTTNLIQNYLSNAATILSNTVAGTSYSVLNSPATSSSFVNFPNGGQSVSSSNLAVSNLFFEAWVNFTTVTSGFQVVFSRATYAAAPDFYYFINSSAQQLFAVSNASTNQYASNTTAISASTWYHIAASWQRTGVNTGTMRIFTNGGLGGTTGSFTVGTNIRYTPNSNVYIGSQDGLNNPASCNVYDVRVITGCIVPTATFTAPAFGAFSSTTLPSYCTALSGNTISLALNSQYFPGASTSPYGPCLTLPGTLGSYYTETGTFLNTTLNSGFTIEAWVNFASLANSNNMPFSASLPFMLQKGLPTGPNSDWFFGPLTTGQLCLDYYNGSGSYGLVTSGTITTGSWNHLVVQGNTAGYVNMYINGQIQTLTGQNYTPTGSGTSSASINGTVSIGQYNGITIGQYNSVQGPNFAIAKARYITGANTYTTTSFTPSPNLGAIPVGATVAWSLDSQYPLPSYPSIQDVTALPSQLTSYGATPVPVGGVTSNVLGPYPTTYPQLDSIRFDGTGYIDYGASATSTLTTNLWANAWTIEGWVYPTTATANIVSRSNTSTGYDWSLGINSTSNVFFDSKATAGEVRGAAYLAGTGSDQGNSVAVDASGNVYVTGSYTSTTTVTLRNMNGTASAYSLPISGGPDAFIVKYNSAGSVVAYSYLQGPVSNRGNSITVDPYGNLYVTGYYYSSGAVTIRNLDTTASASAYSLPVGVPSDEVFIIKYNSSGSVVGYSYINGGTTDAGQSLTVDSSGNLYVTGYYRSTGTVTLRNIDTTASTSSYSLPISSGSTDAFIVKYNSSGSVVAYSYINGTSADQGNSLTVDSSGNLYVTGYYTSSGTVTLRNLDTTASTSAYSLPISGQDVFIIKYNSSGSVVAYSYINAISSDVGYSLAVDSTGNLYVTGFISGAGTVTLRNLDTTASASVYSLPSPSGSYAFIVKYNAAGSVVAYSYIDGTSNDSGQSLAVDSGGNLYVTGYYTSSGTVTLRNIDTTASASAYSLPISSGLDSFIVKYNSSGSVVAYSYVSSPSSDYGYSIAVDSGGNLYVAGAYAVGATVTLRNLDTTASASSYTLPAGSGSTDAFLIKYNTAGTPAIPSAPVNTWTHVAASYDGTTLWVGSAGRMAPTTPASSLPFITDYSTQIGGTFSRGQISGNLADLRVSNVARYTGSSYTVPSEPFATDSSTLLLLKSLAGQVGTTLEVQGRGLNAVSLGATRSVQSYPPAPMSSYLLDTTSNASVTYGQGKYVASASTDQSGFLAWQAFNKQGAVGSWGTGSGEQYVTSGAYTGSMTTVDSLGNSYIGAWLQIQTPASILLTTYQITGNTSYYANFSPSTFNVLGSRDGVNWTLVDSRSAVTWASVGPQTFTVSATQSYNYFRIVVVRITGGSGGTGACITGQWTLNGTEESLCITSDAKVGVGIANPQRALEVAGDLVVSGTISGGAGMGSFRNRIINGDMRIAQRGVSAIVTNLSYYTVDRWYVFAVSGAFQMTQQTLTSSDTPYQVGFRNSVRWTTLTGPINIEMGHNIEGYNIADLNWGTSFGQPITISFWFRSLCTAGSVFSLAVRNASTYAYIVPFTINAPSTWQYYTATIPPPPNGTTWATTNASGLTIEIGSYNTGYQTTALTWNAGNFIMAQGSTNIMGTAGNFIEFTGVQLERGTVATPFEFRGFAQELALCQRYYQVIGQNQSATTYFGTAFAYTSSAAYLALPLGVSMRTAPTSVTSNVASAYKILATGIGGTVASSITLTGTSSQTAGLQIGTGAVLTAGQGVLFYTDNPSTTLGFNAEL